MEGADTDRQQQQPADDRLRRALARDHHRTVAAALVGCGGIATATVGLEAGWGLWIWWALAATACAATTGTRGHRWAAPLLGATAAIGLGLAIAAGIGTAALFGTATALGAGLHLRRRDHQLLHRRQRAIARRRHRHIHERELVAAYRHEIQRLAAAHNAKTEFLTNMSHEIRTPMTGILGYADLLALGGLTEQEARHHVTAIHRNGRDLLGLVDDLLDLARLESGQVEVERLPCSFARILSTVLSRHVPRAKDKQLELELEFTTPVPRTVLTDATRLQQILNHLITNAIKFSECGWVRILVRSTAPGELPAQVRITVADMGVGVDESQQEQIFEAFHQQDASLTRRVGGSGLGLALARNFARKLGGDIEVRSQVGAGSSFCLTFDPHLVQPQDLMLDAGEITLAAGPQVKRQRLKGAALIVEDGNDNQLLLSAQLRRMGLAVQLASDGREGVAMAVTRHDRGQPFDIILMDMQMPVVDGYEATRQLRDRGIATPVIAVTAHAMAGDREKCLQAGCTEYVTKPVRRETLEAVVRAHLAPTRSGSNGAPRSSVRS